jgi:hypothetical protein
MGVFIPDRDKWVDRLIEETEFQITNTRAFLERIHDSEEKTRKYIEELTNHLENDLRRLERERSESE